MFLHEELDAVEQVFKHELARFANMLRLSLIVAFVVLVIALHWNQMLIFVQLREQYVVVEDLEQFRLVALPHFKLQ